MKKKEKKIEIIDRPIKQSRMDYMEKGMARFKYSLQVLLTISLSGFVYLLYMNIRGWNR